MKDMKRRWSILFAMTLPLVGYAQQVAPTDFRGVIGLVLRFLQGITGIAWILLLISFIYGVIRFLMNFSDEHAREEGKRFMVWSLFATAAVFMVWGIIALLTNSVFGTSRFGIPLLSPPTAF